MPERRELGYHFAALQVVGSASSSPDLSLSAELGSNSLFENPS
jgi:hypothetical protein